MTSISATRTVEATAEARLTLLGGFDLEVQGCHPSVPLAVQRLLAFLALHRRPLDRVFVAGTLWSETPERRAHANLRATLWRTRVPDATLLVCTSTHLALAPLVTVDHREALERTRALLDSEATEPSDVHRFDGDLLPGWNDDWIAVERERLRQLRLHALEECCRRLSGGDRGAQAIDFGLTAVAAAPLRESARRALIAAHIANGNLSEALDVFVDFRDLLSESLGLSPSSLMDELIAPLLAPSPVAV